MSGSLHMLVTGATRSGKTYFVDRRVHRAAQCFSLAIHTKRRPKDDFWGPKTETIRGVAKSWRQYQSMSGDQRLFYGHPVFLPSRDRNKARDQLRDLVDELFEQAERTCPRGDHIWCQLVVDEAHVYDEGNQSDPLEEVAREGLGVGIRLVCVTQHPGGLKTHTRTNLEHRVIFHPGREAWLVLRNHFGYPDEVRAHTSQQYHWANDRLGELSYHEPV